MRIILRYGFTDAPNQPDARVELERSKRVTECEAQRWLEGEYGNRVVLRGIDY